MDSETIKLILKEVISSEFVPELIVLDVSRFIYLLSYSEFGRFSEEVHEMAKEMNVAIWMTCQGSYDIFKYDTVVSIENVDNENKVNGLLFHVQVNGSKKTPFVEPFDNKTCRIGNKQ